MALQSASAGYAIAAQTYTRGKLGYPSEAKNWLQNMLGLCPGKVVLEVGAGTG